MIFACENPERDWVKENSTHKEPSGVSTEPTAAAIRRQARSIRADLVALEAQNATLSDDLADQRAQSIDRAYWALREIDRP